MTSIVNQMTAQVAALNPYDSTMIIVNALVVLLLLSLLVLKELLRAGTHPRLELWMQVLNTAIVPLAIASCYIVVIRFLALLPL